MDQTVVNSKSLRFLRKPSKGANGTILFFSVYIIPPFFCKKLKKLLPVKEHWGGMDSLLVLENIHDLSRTRESVSFGIIAIFWQRLIVGSADFQRMFKLYVNILHLYICVSS